MESFLRYNIQQWNWFKAINHSPSHNAIKHTLQ